MHANWEVFVFIVTTYSGLRFEYSSAKPNICLLVKQADTAFWLCTQYRPQHKTIVTLTFCSQTRCWCDSLWIVIFGELPLTKIPRQVLWCLNFVCPANKCSLNLKKKRLYLIPLVRCRRECFYLEYPVHTLYIWKEHETRVLYIPICTRSYKTLCTSKLRISSQIITSWI